MKPSKMILAALLLSMTIGAHATGKVFNAIVASDGSGDFTTVQAAILAAPSQATTPYLIFIKNGIYDELVDIPEDKTCIHLIGQDVRKTIIKHIIHCGGQDSQHFEFSVNNPQSANYKHHAVMDNWGTDFYMENITLENCWGTELQAGPQALAIRTFADRMAFYNCHFRSFQDTWFTTVKDAHRHYIKDCLLEGAVDYIYGSGDVLAENTTFYNVRSGAVITAPSHTNAAYGYIFRDCIVDGNEKAADGKVKLGRPWHNNPVNIWINTTMRIPVAPEGWTNMGAIPKLFAEYGSHDIQGNPINLDQRKSQFEYTMRYTGDKVTGHRPTTISQQEADSIYTYEHIIMAQDGWNPRLLMEHLPAPSKWRCKKNQLSWKPVEGAIGYLVTDGADQVTAITTECQCPIGNPRDSYTIRAISKSGNLGKVLKATRK